jgi:hypothetical protein
VKPLGKTGSRRFVLKDTETLWVWLEHIKNKFPNEPLNLTKNHENTQKKVRLEFGAWIQDGLRHSFGTYYQGKIGAGRSVWSAGIFWQNGTGVGNTLTCHSTASR